MVPPALSSSCINLAKYRGRNQERTFMFIVLIKNGSVHLVQGHVIYFYTILDPYSYLVTGGAWHVTACCLTFEEYNP